VVADATCAGDDGRRVGAEMTAGTEFIGDFLFIEKALWAICETTSKPCANAS
jgi:hypothetical protein